MYIKRQKQLTEIDQAMSILKTIIASENFNTKGPQYTGKIGLDVKTISEDLQEPLKLFLKNSTVFEPIISALGFKIKIWSTTTIILSDNVLVAEHVPFF
jgi:hypothetical protein